MLVRRRGARRREDIIAFGCGFEDLNCSMLVCLMDDVACAHLSSFVFQPAWMSLKSIDVKRAFGAASRSERRDAL